mmetsp:Transcript_25022/g.64590  ORF Transcript_25022/g.64590 Transcript_25022/m.64590 type:complete len:208 (+) Transcript_25022:70-693(+)
MEGGDEALTRMFRVRRTVNEMLKDRDYLVGNEELGLTREQFVDEFQKHGSRDQLTIMAMKKDDPTQGIFVFFPEDAKVGIKPIRKYCEKMQEQGINRAILVVQDAMTSHAKQALKETVTLGLHMEHFQEAELLVNITQHVLVPKHQVMSDDEKRELLRRYKLKDSQLPRIQQHDPVARYYGMTRGQVVKIIRPSETAGRYVTYRLVV